MGSVTGDDDSSAPPSTASSPKTRVKLLCSFGGKIMPRPSDGQLKYIGGETRVLAIHRNINFSELMKKISALFDGDLVLKYQLMPEDLDALVSVRCDEDVKHMLDEFNRQEGNGNSKFRTFLFPSNPLPPENLAVSSTSAIEQRYLDAINGIAHPNLKLPLIKANRPSFTFSTASSPKSDSPEGNIIVSTTPPPPEPNNNRLYMHKVQSSPSLYNINTLQQQHQHHHHQHQHQHQQYYHQNNQQHHAHGSHQPSCRAPHDTHQATFGSRQEYGRGPIPMGHGISQCYVANCRPNIGVGKCNECGYYDEYCSFYGCRRSNRGYSLPQSPRGNNWASEIMDEITH